VLWINAYGVGTWDFLKHIFLTTATTTFVCLLLVFLPPNGGSKTNCESDCEWVNLLKVHHLLVVNILFFDKVGNEHFYASSGQYIFYKKSDHKV